MARAPTSPARCACADGRTPGWASPRLPDALRRLSRPPRRSRARCATGARGQILLRPYNEYLSEYIETVKQLREQFPLPIGIIASEAQQKNFISLMGKILRLRNILTAYDDFETDDIMSPRELED